MVRYDLDLTPKYQAQRLWFDLASCVPFTHMRRYYNICAYLDGDRIMKEMVLVRNAAEAKVMGRTMLVLKGFSDPSVRLSAVRVRGRFKRNADPC